MNELGVVIEGSGVNEDTEDALRLQTCDNDSSEEGED